MKWDEIEKLLNEPNKPFVRGQRPPALRARTAVPLDLEAEKKLTAAALKVAENGRIAIARLEGRYGIAASDGDTNARSRTSDLGFGATVQSTTSAARSLFSADEIDGRPGWAQPPRQPSYASATTSPYLASHQPAYSSAATSSSPYLAQRLPTYGPGTTTRSPYLESPEERTKRVRFGDLGNKDGRDLLAPFARPPGLEPATPGHDRRFSTIDEEEAAVMGGEDDINPEEGTLAPSPRTTRSGAAVRNDAIDNLYRGLPTSGLARKRSRNLLSDTPTLDRSPSLVSLRGFDNISLTRSPSRSRGSGAPTIPRASSRISLRDADGSLGRTGGSLGRAGGGSLGRAGGGSLGRAGGLAPNRLHSPTRGLRRAESTTFETQTPTTPVAATNFSRARPAAANIGNASPRPESPHPLSNMPIFTPPTPAHGSSPLQSRSPSPDRPQLRPGSPEANARHTPVYVFAPDGWRPISEIEDEDLRTKLEEYPVYLCQMGFQGGRDRYKGIMESKDATMEADLASDTSPHRGCILCRVKRLGDQLQEMHACRKCQRANRPCAIYFQHHHNPAIGFLPLRETDVVKKKVVTIRRGTWQDAVYWCVDPDQMPLPQYLSSEETS